MSGCRRRCRSSDNTDPGPIFRLLTIIRYTLLVRCTQTDFKVLNTRQNSITVIKDQLKQLACSRLLDFLFSPSIHNSLSLSHPWWLLTKIDKSSTFSHLLNFVKWTTVKSLSSLTAPTTLWWPQLKKNRLLAIVYKSLSVCYTHKVIKHTNYTHTCGQKMNRSVQSCHDSLEPIHIC